MFILIKSKLIDEQHWKRDYDWSWCASGTYKFFNLVATLLYVKNVIGESKLTEVTKEKLIHILKKVRKEKYLMYKQIAAFAVNIASQMRNNINTQMIEQFINGPESPIKVQ